MQRIISFYNEFELKELELKRYGKNVLISDLGGDCLFDTQFATEYSNEQGGTI